MEQKGIKGAPLHERNVVLDVDGSAMLEDLLPCLISLIVHALTPMLRKSTNRPYTDGPLIVKLFGDHQHPAPVL